MSDGFTTIKTDQGDVKIPHNDKELQKVVSLVYSMDIKLDKAIKALEFYAETDNFDIEGCIDLGDRARQTLKEIRGEKCI